MRDRWLSRTLVLRIDAVSNASLAVFLLAATWDALYEFFGLPVPEPAFYAQILGAVLVALAIIEWTLAGTTAERTIVFAAAVASALSAAILAAWLLTTDAELDSHGLVALWSIAGFLVVAAAVEAVTLSRGRNS
jgi:hypothetical protein